MYIILHIFLWFPQDNPEKVDRVFVLDKNLDQYTGVIPSNIVDLDRTEAMLLFRKAELKRTPNSSGCS